MRLRYKSGNTIADDDLNTGAVTLVIGGLTVTVRDYTSGVVEVTVDTVGANDRLDVNALQHGSQHLQARVTLRPVE